MKVGNSIQNFEESISRIKEIIRENLRDRNNNVTSLMDQLPAEEGKLIRAIFVMLGGSFGEIDNSRLMEISAAVEMLHLATLIHDDIVDETDFRRGKETIHNKYNIKSGLFAGDYLFAQAYVLFSRNCSAYSIEQVSNTIRDICKSEIDQYLSLYSFNSTIRDYLRRIHGKCASLFSLSLLIGAHESKADKDIIEKLKNIGYYAGMAFQLTDDLLDVTSSLGVLGKPAGNDIKQGIYTMPVIYEIKKGNIELEELIKRRQFDDAIDLLQHSEGMKKSREASEKYTKNALRLIEKLPNKEGKESLNKIVEKMLIRKY